MAALAYTRFDQSERAWFEADSLPGTQDTFLPVPRESLYKDSVPNFALYIRIGGKFVLYRHKDLPFTKQARSRLYDNAIDRVYIRVVDVQAYQLYLEENLPKILADPEIPVARKSLVLYSSASSLVKEVLEDPATSENIRRSQDLVARTVDFVLSDGDAIMSLVRLGSHDYRTYTHSVNVCTYALALASRMGIKDEVTLNILGLGALLHDVGKSKVDPAILNKKGPLTASEWTEIKKHPTWGHEILKESVFVPELSVQMSLQHHERCDGSGYPDGITQSKIHPFSRMVGIVDVYDALTTNRPYAQARGPFWALTFMAETMQGQIDESLFKEFIKALGS